MNVGRVALIFDNTLRRETTGVYCRRALGRLVEVEHFLPTELDRIPPGLFDLFINIDDGLDYSLPDTLRPAALWAIDTHIDFDRLLRKAGGFDWVFAAQRDGAERLKAAGVDSAAWLPLACDPVLHGRQPVEKQYDVSFIGNVFPGRREQFLRRIQTQFAKTFVGRRYFREMARVYSASRIVFNVSVADDVNMRVFEGLASGSLLLTNAIQNNGLEELFHDGRQLVTYADADELLDKIRWYLEHADAREEIATAGCEEVLARHTYQRRMQTILDTAAGRPTVPTAGSRTQARPVKESGYYEFVRPEVLALVPPEARRVLDMGCGAGRLGQAIKQRQQCEVIGIELDAAAAGAAEARLDSVVIGNAEDASIDFPAGRFDCVICADVLEHLRAPQRVLKKIARWLSPSGRLVASIPNVRHYTVIEALLAGNFTYEPAGLLDEDHVRFFTRREIQKLFFRNGFDIVEMQVVPGPGYQEWAAEGRPGQVRVGQMQINGFQPAEAEEFFVYQYLVTARPVAVQTTNSVPIIGPIPTADAHVEQPDQSVRIQELAAAFPWPDDKPAVPMPQQHTGWLADGARQVLVDSLDESTRLVVELGAWLGLSTRYMADRAPHATVITVDHWQGSPEHERKPEWRALLPRLYETFLAMSWDYRDRIIPLRMSTLDGLQRVHDARLKPDVIYCDAEHTYEAVSADLDACSRLFPEAVLIGDDHDDPGVARAVHEFAQRLGITVETGGTDWRGWRLNPAGAQVIKQQSSRSGERLTSIILVTHNQWPYTRACLESIRFVTDEPYELIVVDNGSTDGTVDELRAQVDVTLIENRENRGFPAAANQGIRVARGESLLLLNNDTLATTGWLRRMLDALWSDERIGLVGPCTNAASGPQQVPAGYQSLNSLDGFAWEWSVAHRGQRIDVDRLVGFCLLLKRAVVERIGVLDERFGIGNFEDDDICRRALDAGYRCVIAADAYIHHFGHTTFRATGVDFARLLEDNQRKYEAKWSEPGPAAGESPSGPANEALASPIRERFALRIAEGGGLILVDRETPEEQPASAPTVASVVEEQTRPSEGTAPRLSLCMIVRDNENTIRPCLESIRPWVDEMIVVDTGSHDATPRIAEELGAHVHHFPWCDDFSAARNESLKYASGEWIFWMDSDDTIPADCGRRLRALAYGHHPDTLFGYVMQVHCPGEGADGEHDVTVVDHVKLFRNRTDLRFEFRIHEQIIPAIRRAGGEVAFTDVYVVHSGSDHSAAGRQRKYDRDFRILARDLEDRPEHPFVLFNLGMTYADARDFVPAVDHLRRCIAVTRPDESHLRKAYALLVSTLTQAERHEEAWESCRQGLALFGDDQELLFRSALLHHHFGRLREAEGDYLRALKGPKERHFASVDCGIGGFKARHNLAIVYEEMGDLEKAAAQWKSVIDERPGYRPAYRALAELWLKHGKINLVEKLIEERMTHSGATDAGLCCESRLLTARLAEARGDVEQARRLYEEVVAQFACEPEPLRSLCRFLFEHDGPARAEAALLKLAKRDKDDASAFHNLGTAHLHRRQPRKAASAYRHSLALRGDSATTYLHLGYALRDCGSMDEAIAAWKTALRHDVHLQPAADALRETELLPTERPV